MSQDSVKRITVFLQTLISRDGYAEKLVEAGFRSITPEAIRMWVKEGVKLLPDGVKKLYFENPLVAPMTRRVLIHHWRVVDHYLGHPENTLEKISAVNPDNARVLRDKGFSDYILKEVNDTYNYLKRFVGDS
ncbi:hypothetical protein B9Q04_20105 [Candidatus Marsarchaeota G2 archaeon BE_D]|uniref:Uncharacterized protein n=1 Tax=Candidatus Marsarchaeota G2 archaeon BE_D TaxID=1978158 RepID=A0A2R6BYD1_9ARCH|nr:MAG: hypothetical protein B9Q04_20105 [Candidatus Marsarchaeota G2 archaeon BE_D]